jgi:hypothetical protein
LERVLDKVAKLETDRREGGVSPTAVNCDERSESPPKGRLPMVACTFQNKE